MARLVRYLTHPQVKIDPQAKVEKWSLNSLGQARAIALAESCALEGTQVVVSSGETKAIETAEPIAKALGCRIDIRQGMHENDRSATGFLPPDEFEAVADQFFAFPDDSVRGWETARDAQSRIVAEVRECLQLYPHGDVLLVGHGGVGTLLLCHLFGVGISRAYDQGAGGQGAGGGGCFFEFADLQSPPFSRWRPLEDVLTAGG